MASGSTAAVGGGVYFFLSYAHAPRRTRADDPLDKPVRDFFNDLSAEVARLLGLPRGSPVGFADWQIRTGEHWRQELGRVLGTCGAFVPLCTPRYFEREMCGREWAAFHRRELRHQAQTKEGKSAIIPIIWTPMYNGNMPPAAQSLHYLLPNAGEIYRKRAMRELVMRSGNREEIREAYRIALTAFADYIVEVAQTGPLSAKDDGVLDLNPHENAFADKWSRSDPRPLRFVIVAPVQGKLPPKADPRLYGNSPEKWRPYQPADETPIAETAAMLAETDDFQPFVEFLGACPDLLDGAEPSAPTVLIVDPWAVQDPELAEMLRAFDAISHDKPWIRLVIPWDRNGSGDGNQISELEEGLQRALYRTRSHCRITNPEAVAGLPTVAAFGERLPGVIAAAEKGYFRRMETRLPNDAAQRLPQFGDATPENSPSYGRAYRGWKSR